VALYDSLVRMVQDFSLRYPLVDGQGNFGSVDGDSPAAYRYTEARLTRVAMTMLEDIDKNTVVFVPNFDDRLQEPTVLPARLPNLIVNGSAGIAVGMATNIPPHNLAETIAAINHLVDHGAATVKDLRKFIKGPDFPTGAIIYGRQGIKECYEKGRGRIVLRARATVEERESTGKQQIVVTEFPYQVSPERVIEQIRDLALAKKLDGIADLRNESDKEGIRAVIELKRDAVPMVVLNQLYMHTQMQVTFGAIMLALVDGVPKEMNLKELLEHFIDHRHTVITRRTEFELQRAQDREHILEGLKIAVDHIDEVIKIIRKSKDTLQTIGAAGRRDPQHAVGPAYGPGDHETRGGAEGSPQVHQGVQGDPRVAPAPDEDPQGRAHGADPRLRRRTAHGDRRRSGGVLHRGSHRGRGHGDYGVPRGLYQAAPGLGVPAPAARR
jgi:DNA gyrase subunit A